MAFFVIQAFKKYKNLGKGVVLDEKQLPNFQPNQFFFVRSDREPAICFKYFKFNMKFKKYLLDPNRKYTIYNINYIHHLEFLTTIMKIFILLKYTMELIVQNNY